MRLPLKTPTLTKGRDAVREKQTIQAKDEVAVVIDHGLILEPETRVPTPIMIPDQKEKERAEIKKANKDHTLVPLAIANRQIHAAIAAVKITPLEPVINDRMTRKMARQNQQTNKLTSASPLTRRP